MDPLLLIEPARLSVDPGGEVRTQVTVRNPGDIVEQYRFQVLGEAARWAQVVPKDVSVLPGKAAEMTVQVVFRPPPAPAAPAGDVPFGIRCVSLERPDNVAVIEGDVTVSAVLDLQATLHPLDQVGRWKGRFRLELRNTGTLPITVRVGVVDEAKLLRIAVAPTELTVDARGTEPVYIAAKPRTTKIIGKPVEHTLDVTYEVPGTDKAGTLQTVYEQRPLIRKWMIITALVALLSAAVVLFFVVVRPGADPGPALTAGPPPAIGPAPQVQVLGPDSVQLDWQANPYATSYDLLMKRNGSVVQTATVNAPQVSFVWSALAGGGTSCFQVVPKNANGAGPATEASCQELQGLTAAESSAAAVSAEAAASSAAASSAAAAESASAAASSAAAASAAAASTSAAAASSAAQASSAAASSSSAVAAGQFVPRRFWVIYYRTPLDDALLTQAVQVQASLQGAGVDAQLIDSTTLKTPIGTVGLWLVISDNYADRASAQAECNARNGTVANVTCTVQNPAPA